MTLSLLSGGHGKTRWLDTARILKADPHIINHH
jgi:hypothetical protein